MLIAWFAGLTWWEQAFFLFVLIGLISILGVVLNDYVGRREDPTLGRCSVCNADLSVFKRSCKKAGCPFFQKRGTE